LNRAASGQLLADHRLRTMWIGLRSFSMYPNRLALKLVGRGLMGQRSRPH
jgi:hypothetical protein